MGEHKTGKRFARSMGSLELGPPQIDLAAGTVLMKMLYRCPHGIIGHDEMMSAQLEAAKQFVGQLRAHGYRKWSDPQSRIDLGPDLRSAVLTFWTKASLNPVITIH